MVCEEEHVSIVLLKLLINHTIMPSEDGA